MENTDSEMTLPSVVSSVTGTYRAESLVLTLLFHPQISRIGECAVVPKCPSKSPWVLGRRSPEFSRANTHSSGQDIADPHISRQALEFIYGSQELRIRRFPGSSRAQVAGEELEESIVLSSAQLRAGVALLLGHSIVLMLRLGPAPLEPDTEEVGGEVLLGASATMSALRGQIATVAASDADVLIRGETGTGKELVAGAIHRASSRAAAPLVSVNMAAIPTELAPAALFGSAKGAFTGAGAAVSGYFEQAEGGVLFLDEIGDAPREVQPQLLRALQQREIQPVGGAIKALDLRIISATDAELDEAALGFKSALRHRLGALELSLPALRDHPEDIGELLLHFFTSLFTANAAANFCK